MNSGFTLAKVALDVGLEDPLTLEKYESGHDPIPVEIVCALANTLNVPPEEVVNLVGDIDGENDFHETLWRRLDSQSRS